ncbi:MAG: PorP/SprF family type IX secretion system membrane protein, partial [Flavobacteriales bacterium]
MKKWLFYIACFSISAASLAQDVQLSQFQNLSVLINPASAGSAEEDVRVTLAYRSQWGSLDEPFVTNLVTAEYNPNAGNRRKSHFGFGLAAFTDKGGTSGYQAATFRGMAAYHFKLSAKKELSFGLEASYNQRSFSLDGLAWDTQFNGVAYDPSLPTQENWNANAVSNLDFGFGAEFRNTNDRKMAWQSGVALHHYYQDQSTLENGEDPLPT